MADNISVTPGTGKTVATDEVTDGVLGTVQVQIVKVMDGTLDSTNKMSISAAGAVKVDGSAVTQPVSGTVTATGPLTDTQLRAVPVPVSGTVTATGPLTDTQLRAVPVPVSGTVAVSSVGGTVAVSGPLTDIQLRAVAVPVSGTVTATGPLTDTQLRAAVVPVSVTAANATLTNGAETAVSSSAVQILASLAGRKMVIVQNTGNANIRVGVSGVTAATGIRLAPSGTVTFSGADVPTQAIFAIRETSTDSIAFAQSVA